MADEDRNGEAQAQPPRSSDEDIASFRTRRNRPKPLTRPPADKMMRPSTSRGGYETK